MPRSRVANASPATDPYTQLAGGDSAGTLSVAQEEWGVLGRAIQTVTHRGDALVFSRTSDGGALSIRALHDKLVTKWYASDLDELERLLEALASITDA